MAFDYRSIEQKARALALFSLVAIVVWSTLSAWSFVSPPLSNWISQHRTVPSVVAVASILAMVAALAAAIFIVSADETMDAKSRSRWIIILILTSMFGGPLFLTRRWWQQVRARLR